MNEICPPWNKTNCMYESWFEKEWKNSGGAQIWSLDLSYMRQACYHSPWKICSQFFPILSHFALVSFTKAMKLTWKMKEKFLKCMSILGKYIVLNWVCLKKFPRGRCKSKMAEKSTKPRISQLLAKLLGWKGYQNDRKGPQNINF